MKTRMCLRCNLDLPLKQFPRRKNSDAEPLKYWCHSCLKETNQVRGKGRPSRQPKKQSTKVATQLPSVHGGTAIAERSVVFNRTYAANRGALVRYAIGRIPPEDMYLKIQLQDYKCMYCKTPISFNTCHIDHIHALVKGGEHYLYNIALTCSVCNLTKHARSLQTFCKRMGFDYEVIKQEIAEINHQLHILVFGLNWRDKPVTGYDKTNDDLDD